MSGLFRKLHSKRGTALAASILALVGLIAPSTAFAGEAQRQNRVLVGVGDSFTAGEGNPPFEAGTDTSTDQCHRSSAAYPIVAAKLLGIEGRNIACSGAETKDLFTTFQSEPAQAFRIDRAQNVVVTIGGNDVNALDAISNPPAPQQVAAELQALEPVLVDTYRYLHSVDPRGHISAVGYPSLFGTAPAANCPLSQEQRATIVQFTLALDSTIRQAAAQAHVQFVDAFGAFAGHEICTADPWVNGIDTAHPSFSLHPNAVGQLALSETVVEALQIPRS